MQSRTGRSVRVASRHGGDGALVLLGRRWLHRGTGRPVPACRWAVHSLYNHLQEHAYQCMISANDVPCMQGFLTQLLSPRRAWSGQMARTSGSRCKVRPSYTARSTTSALPAIPLCLQQPPSSQVAPASMICATTCLHAESRHIRASLRSSSLPELN